MRNKNAVVQKNLRLFGHKIYVIDAVFSGICPIQPGQNFLKHNDPLEIPLNLITSMQLSKFSLTIDLHDIYFPMQHV